MCIRVSISTYRYRCLHTYKLSTDYPAPGSKAHQAGMFSLMSSSKDPVNLGGSMGYIRRTLDVSYMDKGLLWNEKWVSQFFPIPSLREEEGTIYTLCDGILDEVA